MSSRITAEEFLRTIREGLPSADAMQCEVVTLEHGLAVVRMPAREADLRPGETVAGPVLFALADVAMFAAVMSAVGLVPLVVTTDATIHFLRRPRAGALIARARLLKEGRRLVIGEVEIVREDEPNKPVAHAVMTYSVPPER